MSKAVELLRRFAAEEKGVVTAEWVALAGAIVIGAITVGWLVLNSLQSPASNIGTNLASCEATAASASGATTGCK